MRSHCALVFLIILTAVSGLGCRDDPESSEESARRAWQVAEQAQDEARQADRLRDVDRVRYDHEKGELASEKSSLIALSSLLSLLAIGVLLWVAVEVRRRRMWSHVARTIAGVPDTGNKSRHTNP